MGRTKSSAGNADNGIGNSRLKINKFAKKYKKIVGVNYSRRFRRVFGLWYKI